MSDIAALLAEREGYVRRGLANRVVQVDAEIKRLGGVIVDDAPVETADATPPKRTRAK
jgi:hypothetical protein